MIEPSLGTGWAAGKLIDLTIDAASEPIKKRRANEELYRLADHALKKAHSAAPSLESISESQSFIENVLKDAILTCRNEKRDLSLHLEIQRRFAHFYSGGSVEDLCQTYELTLEQFALYLRAVCRSIFKGMLTSRYWRDVSPTLFVDFVFDEFASVRSEVTAPRPAENFDLTTLTAISLKCNDCYSKGETDQGFEIAHRVLAETLSLSKGQAPREKSEKDPLSAVAITGLRCATYTADGGKRAAAYLHKIIIKLLRTEWFEVDRSADLLLELISLNHGLGNTHLASEILRFSRKFAESEDALRRLLIRSAIIDLSERKKPDLAAAIEIPGPRILHPRDAIRSDMTVAWKGLTHLDFDKALEHVHSALSLSDRLPDLKGSEVDPIMLLELRLALFAISSHTGEPNSENEIKLDELFERHKARPLIIKPNGFRLVTGFGALNAETEELVAERYLSHNPRSQFRVDAARLVATHSNEAVRLLSDLAK